MFKLIGTYFIQEVSVKRIEYHFQLSVVRKCILYKIYFYVHIIIAFNNFLCSFIILQIVSFSGNNNSIEYKN